MNDENREVLGQIMEAVAKHFGTRIPIEIDLWSGDEIAAYLKKERRTVMERIVCLPSFPRAIRLPTATGGSAQPLWQAKQVIAWALSYQDTER